MRVFTKENIDGKKLVGDMEVSKKSALEAVQAAIRVRTHKIKKSSLVRGAEAAVGISTPGPHGGCGGGAEHLPTSSPSRNHAHAQKDQQPQRASKLQDGKEKT